MQGEEHVAVQAHVSDNANCLGERRAREIVSPKKASDGFGSKSFMKSRGPATWLLAELEGRAAYYVDRVATRFLIVTHALAACARTQDLPAHSALSYFFSFATSSAPRKVAR